MSASAGAVPPLAGMPQACSPGQRRLWLLDRIEPGHPGLHIAARWRLEGRVPTSRLQEAFGQVVARHPALRTAIVGHDGTPLQWLAASARLRVGAIDLTALAENDARVEAERLAQAEARAAFDLSQAPLLRVTQLCLREDLSIVLVTAHRIACDDASVAILAREVCALLGGARLSDLPEVPLPAAPGAGTRADEEYWAGALRGLQPFALQPDRVRPAVQTARGAIASRPVEPALVRALQELAQRHETSLFVAALAALFALLRRYSGEADIAVGSTVPQRDGRGLRDAVGPFAGTLVLRADLSGDVAFTALLAQVCSTVAAGLAHASTPLERVIELLVPERDLSRNALFSVAFEVRAAQVGGTWGAVRLVELPPCSAGVVCDLAFLLAERHDGWHLSCEYNTDLFEPQTARQLLDHFARVLAAVAAAPERRISALPVLDDTEREALVTDRNRTAAEYPATLTVPALFARQVRRTPEAVAVRCGDAELSYRQLDAASSRIARELGARGIGRGARVGVCLERSADLVAALLGVLRAGAAYVPLDPAYPPARLAQIAADARPQAVLTTLALGTRLPAGAPQIMVDAGSADGGAAGRAEVEPGPDDVAYVIYTSGSTGRPKGVPIRHRGLTNLLWAMRLAPGLAAADTLLAVTTPAFDIAALELFLPLVVGARVVVAREADVGDGAALLRLLREQRITVMQATPVTWQILLAAGWRGDPALKMLCGGEALPRALADRLLGTGGELWNLYGPTETTIWSAALRVEPGAGPVPIGPPIANTQFYVLDAHGGLVPPGAPGELFIGGDGVATGYLNLPELTQERFVPDPFAGTPGATLYRTGDRVRWREGGLEFLGRADRQVKLRGFRIELGEIESVLRAHAQVADAVAVLAPEASGDSAVRAYAAAPGTPPDGRAALAAALQAALRRALPAYMCPAGVVVLAALPRLPNGKLDAGALPAVAPPPRRGVPRTASELERRVAAQWSAVLGVSDIGVDENFFEAGGHSLLAVRLLARIEAEFGRTLTLAALFRHATVADQARLIEHGDPHGLDFRQIVKLQPGGTRPPLIALNNTGIYYGLSRRLGSDQPFVSLQLFDPARPHAALPRTLEEIAAAYVELIRRVQRTGPYALLGWCVAGTLAFEVARQLRAAGHRVSRLIVFDTLAPGHLRRLSWLRAALADYAYRWQLVAADWRRTRLQRDPLRTFLLNRVTVRGLLRRLGRAPAAGPAAPAPGVPLTPEQYDEWLLRYLEAATAAYEPRAYAGAMTLFRSSEEPAGPFLDPYLGWRPFVEGGVDLVVVDGDHFSIFQEPRVAQLARRLEAGADSGATGSTRPFD